MASFVDPFIMTNIVVGSLFDKFVISLKYETQLLHGIKCLQHPCDVKWFHLKLTDLGSRQQLMELPCLWDLHYPQTLNLVEAVHPVMCIWHQYTISHLWFPSADSPVAKQFSVGKAGGWGGEQQEVGL